MRKIITEELKRNIKDYYQSRPMTIGEVCKEFSLSSPTILKILNGIPKYSKTKIYNPELDEDFFSSIDTESKAYFLGLFISDGNIFDPSNSKHPGQKWVSITLQTDDSYILQNFKDDIKATTKISEDGRGSSYIAIRSNKMADDLEKYGVIPRKSFKTRFPFEVNKKYYRHIIRGIMDGDGSIQAHLSKNITSDKIRFLHNISFCGSHRLMCDIVNVISSRLKLKVQPTVYDYKNRTLSEFKIQNADDMKTFGEWVYKDANIYLLRKKEQYDKFKEYYNL